MRVRLPALLAVISATTYAACGSSNDAKHERAGGAAGENEGGEGPSPSGGQGGSGAIDAGGKAGNGGSGDTAAVGGEAGGAGESTLGGASSGGAGGAGGESPVGAAGGAGGEAPVVEDFSLRAACPGVIGDYTTLIGTADSDDFGAEDVAGQKLIFGLDGADTFAFDSNGQDCIVGGAGDDDFAGSGEFASYYYGGAGSDVYHIDRLNNYVRIADMSAEDRISLSLATFGFLTGQAGDAASATQVVSMAGYATGTDSGVGEQAALIYDPNTGELWRDLDGYGKDQNAQAVLTIINKEGYTFDIDDFVLE